MTENHNSVVNEFISELVGEKPQQFSYGQLMSFTSNLQFRIGSGGYGDVYKGVFPNGIQIAVKVLKNTMMDVMKKQFMSEVGTMGRTYHRNLIKLYGFCFDVNIKALVYEYMENGSFDKILYENDPHIKWVALYDIAIDIAKGLSYLHEYCSPQIIHHDIKPANVLLDLNFCPKISDFGLAKLNKDLSHFAQTGYRGTPGYAAPEVSMNHPSITCKCDVFSFGIMLFDILKRKKYSEGEEWLPAQVWEHLQIGQLDKIIMKCGVGMEDKEDAERLSKVALLCAQYKAQDRPSMSTVVKMLEGEIPPWTPVDPFPYYVSSSESHTGCARRRSTRIISPANDERLQGNFSVSTHGRRSEAREPESIQGAFLNTPMIVQNNGRLYGNVPVSSHGSSSEAREPESTQGAFLNTPIVQNNERLHGSVPFRTFISSSELTKITSELEEFHRNKCAESGGFQSVPASSHGTSSGAKEPVSKLKAVRNIFR